MGFRSSLKRREADDWRIRQRDDDVRLADRKSFDDRRSEIADVVGGAADEWLRVESCSGRANDVYPVAPFGGWQRGIGTKRITRHHGHVPAVKANEIFGQLGQQLPGSAHI